MSDERRCRKCDVVLVAGENWYASFAKKRHHICRACYIVSGKARYKANRDRRIATSKAWVAANKDRRTALSMVGSAKIRAAKKGVPFDLDGRTDDLHEIIKNGTCHYTGLPFNLYGGRTWDSPSLDRVVPDRGYVWTNVRVVIHAINSFKGTVPLEKVCWIAEHLLDWQKRKGKVFNSDLQKVTND